MLPLEIDRRGYLRAAGNFDEPGRPLVVGRSPPESEDRDMIRGLVRFVDQRSGSAPLHPQDAPLPLP